MSKDSLPWPETGFAQQDAFQDRFAAQRHMHNGPTFHNRADWRILRRAEFGLQIAEDPSVLARDSEPDHYAGPNC